MAVFLENFLSIRKLYPRRSERAPSNRLVVAPPADETERDYRDLLSEANLNYFHREYSIALDNYLALRHLILTQSHPEMPRVPGLGLVSPIDPSVVKIDRLFEFSRRMATVEGRVPLDPRPVFSRDEIEPNPALAKVRDLGISGFDVRRDSPAARARELIAAGDLAAAGQLYRHAEERATRDGDAANAARLANESGAMLATYARGEGRREALTAATEATRRAEELFLRLGDTVSRDVARANRRNIELELDPQRPDRQTAAGRATIPLASGGHLEIRELLRPETVLTRIRLGEGTVQPQSQRILMVQDAGGWKTAAGVVDTTSAATLSQRSLGLMTSNGVETIPLAAGGFDQALRQQIYEPRITATALEGLSFHEVIEPNFVSYFVHLYFFVLPIAIGDTYLAQGRFSNALQQYRSVLAYPFLNAGIEAPYVWLKMAGAYLQWGDRLFRRGADAAATSKYEQIIGPDLGVPASSEIYAHPKLTALRTTVTEVAKELRGEAHQATNPRVGQLVASAVTRLRYLGHGLNFFGIADDHAPVFRFKYLQSVATYMADSAIEAERTFISFRSSAESQKMESMQLQGALDVNKAALAVEQKRKEDAALEVEAGKRTREYAETRRDNAAAALAEWDTKGRELTSMSSMLSWASNAANDQDIRVNGVLYDGGSHDYEGDVEDFYEVVGQKRDWLDWELQRNRIVRQQVEIDAEVAMAETREQQARVRQEVQQLNVVAQQKRVEAAQELVDFAEDRLFDEDLWFQLAAELQDLARGYLDAAIYASLLMERAYGLEFDRHLNRIRTDYGIGGPAGLLGGDHLKRDILSFNQDYLQHAQKKNPVRLALSLRDEFPSGYATFVESGILPFRTDLEIFDRRYPGTYRRKIKRVELFVEGLVPLEGASGLLTNNGITTDWRLLGGSWTKHTRVTPVEQMVLSSYQFRRDLAVFQPSEELLGLFENLAPQCEWTLEIPASGNNVDYEAISDVKLVLYFDADTSDSLAEHLAATLPGTGARSTVLSSRFHYPDEYFRLDAEGSVDFAVSERFFAYNHLGPTLGTFGVRLLPRPGADVSNRSLTLTRLSDDATITAATDAQGVISSDAGAVFDPWLGASALDTWRVSFDDAGDVAATSDVQLFFTYAFTYRPNGSFGP